MEIHIFPGEQVIFINYMKMMVLVLYIKKDYYLITDIDYNYQA
jgi:hypothetical protein